MPGGTAFGGAVYVAGGTANITNTTFTGNTAQGGGLQGTDERIGGNAFGGALYVAAGQVILTNATVTSIPPRACQRGGSAGYGGGLCVAGGTVTLANDTVECNSAYGANGYGGGLYVAGGTVTLYQRHGGMAIRNGDVPARRRTAAGIFIASGATVYLDSFTVANTINNTDSTGLNGSTANIDGTYIETPAAGQPPIVVHAASANPSPVTGTTTNLSVLGADAAGAASLTYTWAVTSALPAPPRRPSAATAATPPRTPRPPSTAPALTPSRSPSPTRRA